MIRELLEGVKRFGIAIIGFALLGYGSFVYGNIYGVWIAIILILISLAIATKTLLYNRQRVMTIKKPFM